MKRGDILNLLVVAPATPRRVCHVRVTSEAQLDSVFHLLQS